MATHNGNQIEKAAAHLLGDTILVGPLVEDADGVPYIIVMSGNASDRDSYILRMEGNDEHRTTLLIRLALQRRVTQIHDLDDEMTMARLAHAIWPNKKHRRIIENLKKERKSMGC